MREGNQTIKTTKKHVNDFNEAFHEIPTHNRRALDNNRTVRDTMYSHIQKHLTPKTDQSHSIQYPHSIRYTFYLRFQMLEQLLLLFQMNKTRDREKKTMMLQYKWF